MIFTKECFQTARKSLARILMGTLTTIKFNGSCIMHEYVIEMTNIASKLKSLEMNVDVNFLVLFIINWLPPGYGPFQINYNTIKDKWNIHELHSMLVQEETRFKSLHETKKIIYVDDSLLESNDLNLLHETKNIFSNNFKMIDMREVTYMIGIEIFWDRSQELFGLSQKAYINKV